MKRKSVLSIVLLSLVGWCGAYAQVQVADTSIVQSLERVTGNARVRLFQDARLPIVWQGGQVMSLYPEHHREI